MKTTRLCAVLFGVPLLAQAQSAPVSTEAPSVVVTGSRIPRAGLEGPSAVTVISAQDIEREGYKNVFDALSNQTQNSGFVQGADFGNTFTPSANAVSLRGLGPNHTLILLNGRRLADFPTAYDGTVNFNTSPNSNTTNYALADVLTGNFSTYSEAASDPTGFYRFSQYEAFTSSVFAGRVWNRPRSSSLALNEPGLLSK